MLKIDLITRDYNGEINGLSRYDRALYEGLSVRNDLQIAIRPVQAPRSRILDGVRRATGLDLATFLSVYPAMLPDCHGTLRHITTNSHTTALLCAASRPTIVTVHDIIHYTHRYDQRLSTYQHSVQQLADTLSLYNLRYATMVIASSNDTKQQLVSQLNLPANQIIVIPLGVDTNRFFPQVVPASFYERYRLDTSTPYVLHISSEEPRKNIETLLRAWVLVQREYPNAMLLKVGRCLYPTERVRLLALISELGISASVRFIDAVPDEDLPLFYNAARVFAFPSLAEGFGFPVLEALACCTAVVCSDAPALTEIVEGVALQHTAADDQALASAIKTLLGNISFCDRMSQAGLHRAADFSWSRTMDRTYDLYIETILGSRTVL